MILSRVQGPTTLPVSVAEAKANGRIDHSAEDGLIEGYIRAALAHAEKSCGVAFEGQTWEQAQDGFSGPIRLCMSPVTSVVSITYTDADGATVEMAPADFTVRSGVVSPASSWPSASSVTVRFTVGSGTPADVKQAILLLVEHWNENRAAASEADVKSIPFGVEALLSLHRRLFI